MISYAARTYWTLCRSYNNPTVTRHIQALLINGEALIVRETAKSPAVKERTSAFIEAKRTELGITARADNLASFVP